MGRIVGIDLGTTTCVAVLEAGRPQVIANAEGGRTTPSVVGYSKDQELLVGQLARRQLVLSPATPFRISVLSGVSGMNWTTAASPFPTPFGPMTEVRLYPLSPH